MDKTNNYWSYWDFVVPFRWGNKKLLNRKIGLFLFLEFFIGVILAIIIFGLFDLDNGLTSMGRIPITLADLLAIVAWFTNAWVLWVIYDKKYQKS